MTAHSIAATLAASARTIDQLDSTFVLWAFLVLLITIAVRETGDYVSDRRVLLNLMASFGERFVHEFDRPLVRSRPSDRVVDSQLRFDTSRSKVEVLLAPRDGRSYPNLTDHRKNVEYDVVRVLRLMKDPPFIPGVMYAQGRWVVVPFQLKVNPGQAGDK